jgi:hypothetical protein
MMISIHMDLVLVTKKNEMYKSEAWRKTNNENILTYISMNDESFVQHKKEFTWEMTLMMTILLY